MINSVLKNKVYIALAIIVLLAGVLRFYKLGQVPISLYWDETSLAYNAYSIAETGKDEFGKNFPLLFRAFDDYKTPGYVYLAAIPIKLFGLSEFSARFPSALLGTLTVFVTFFLILELIRKKIFEIDPEYIGLLTALLVAISPVHIQFSRAGFEANAGLFFVVLGAFLFLKYINSNRFKYLAFSMIIYSLSIYFYRSIWIFTPLFLVSLFLIYHKILFSKENLKKTFFAVLIFSVILLPFIPNVVSSGGQARTAETSIFNNSHDEVYKAIQKMEKNNSSIGKVIYNRRVVYLQKGIKGYLSHFSPRFMFFMGDGNARHGVDFVGIFYIWGLIFIIPGILVLTKIERKSAFVIISWLLIAPIPAALSVPAPHSLRSLNMIPILQLLIAFGIILTLFAAGKKYKTAVSAIIIGFSLYFITSYLSTYYSNYANGSSRQWADGYKELTSYVFENENKYDKIIISGHYWQPYIYFLFYKKYDPVIFQSSGSKSGFDKYIFGGTSWDHEGIELDQKDLPKLAGSSNFLVALSPWEYDFQEKNIKVVKKLYNHRGELIFIIGENVK